MLRAASERLRRAAPGPPPYDAPSPAPSAAPQPTDFAGGGRALRTPSLRRRVTLVVLLLLTVLLGVLGVTTDLVLHNRLQSQLDQRLLDRAAVAKSLAGTVSAEELAQRLDGSGVSVRVVTSDGEVTTAGPPPVGPNGRPAPPQGAPARPGGKAAASKADAGTTGSTASDSADGPTSTGSTGVGGSSSDTTGSTGSSDSSGGDSSADAPVITGADGVIVTTGDQVALASDLGNGTTLTLSADGGEVRRTVEQTRIALLAGALAVLLLAGAVVRPVVGRVLRPLDHMTGLARSIRGGDRGHRLRPDRPSTELGTTAQAFDEMLDAVEVSEKQALEAERRLRGFLSDAAHELRTPIAGVQAAAEHVLRSNPDRAEREQTLMTLVRESRRAGRLVDDMLLMAKIDRGLELRLTPVDLTALAETVTDTRRLTHPEAGLETDGAPLVVLADADRITQVMGNLLDNALRATGPSGRVRLAVSEDPVTHVARVDVTDSGPGIPVADSERVFERLVRLDEARTSQDSGAGLGLPIARGIARAHHGDLACLPRGRADGSSSGSSYGSSYGSTYGGAHFRLTLPLPHPA